MDKIANSSHAKLKPRPPWKPGCEPKADKNKLIKIIKISLDKDFGVQLSSDR